MRKEERRTKWIKAKEEEEERKRTELRRREEEEKSRLEEIARKEREDKEKAEREEREKAEKEKREMLDRVSAKQRQREEEIERKLQERETAATKELKRDTWRKGDAPRRPENESSWRRSGDKADDSAPAKNAELWKSCKFVNNSDLFHYLYCMHFYTANTIELFENCYFHSSL